MPEMTTVDNLTLHVRSIHTTRWLWIDNAVYDRYAAQLGPEGLGVYVGLARYANNKTAKCWPSMTRLATEMGTDLYTIEAALERIVSAGLLHVSQEPGKGTVLTLLDAQHASAPEPVPVVTETPAPVETSSPSLACASDEPNPELNINKNKFSSGSLGNETKEQHPVSIASRWEKDQLPDGSWNKGPVCLPAVNRP